MVDGKFMKTPSRLLSVSLVHFVLKCAHCKGISNNLEMCTKHPCTCTNRAKFIYLNNDIQNDTHLSLLCFCDLPPSVSVVTFALELGLGA